MFYRFLGLFIGMSFFFSGGVAEGGSLTKVFKEVNPAVVTILATGHGYSKTRPGEKVVSKGLGSGFVVGKNGLVMTAAHVVQVADTVVVEFLNGKKIGARVQGSVALADVALLQLDKVPSGLVSVRHRCPLRRFPHLDRGPHERPKET